MQGLEGLSGPGPSPPDAGEVGRIFREESGRCVATLIRVFGDIDLAEDAVQEAFAVAIDRWPAEGMPRNPGAWITSTARRRLIDRLRRESRGQALLEELALEAGDTGATDTESDAPEEAGPMEDDRLRLLFTCCHPALSTEAQVALTLRLLGGLTTEEVARAFLVTESTMAQRLVRAKGKIKATHIPYRVPEAEELPARLRPVLAVTFLIYNAGSDAPPEDGSRRDGLCDEALRLARVLVSLMPDELEVTGLLALILLCESRRGARFTSDGSLVLLRDQDRAHWDHSRIEEGQNLVRRCLQENRPGPYQIQAAIHAVHADAESVDATDWRQIVALYDLLLAQTPTPVVALNRAVAVGEVNGPAEALSLIEELKLERYAPFHAARADLLRRLDRLEESESAYRTAASLVTTQAEERFFLDQARDVASN